MANWDKRFLELALHISKWSKDTSTKVGAVIANDEHRALSIGYKGFPSGVNDSVEWRYERPQKYKYTEHAERNAVYSAARNGININGATIYLHWYPCVDCARAIIQAGIKTLIGRKPDWDDKTWGADFKIAKELFEESGVKVVFFNGLLDGEPSAGTSGKKHK